MDGDKFVYATLYARILAKVSIAVNTTFTVAALVLLVVGNVTVYWSSFTPQFQYDILVKGNHTDPLKMRVVHSFFDPSSGVDERIKNENRHLNIEYGTTWESHCENDPIPTEGLPSILRSIEFHSVSQLLLRFTFLVSLSLRPIVTYYRSMTVLTRLSANASPPLPACGSIASSSAYLRPVATPLTIISSIILHASPALQFLSTFSGTLVMAWQQNLDFHDLMWAPYYTFALFYMLHILAYAGIELMEPKRMNIPRVLTRSLLIFTFVLTIKPIIDRQMEFLDRKTCHVIVPTLDAIAEYLCFLSITVFSLLEWTDVWNIQVTVVENPQELATLDRSKGMEIAEEKPVK